MNNSFNFPLQYALQFIGQGFLLAALWSWLGIPDAQAWQLALSALTAILYFVTQTVLNAYTLGQLKQGRLNQAIWSLPLAAIILLAFTHWAACLVGVLLLLLILLPSAAQGAFKLLPKPQYLFRAAALLALGIAAPKVLLEWTPKLDGLYLQMASLAARALIGYSMTIFAWTSLLDLARQAVTQDSPAAEAPAEAQPQST
jgi:hypothetical protein